jgi:hypothetical protein
MVALLVAGCSATEGESVTAESAAPVAESPVEADTTPEPSASPTVGDAFEPMLLPMAAYMPPEDEHAAIQRANGLLVEECMAAKGFDWPARPPELGNVFARNVRGSRRYAYVDDRDVAAEWGYHVVETREIDDLHEKPSEELLSALDGDYEWPDPPGGCMGEAHERLAGDMELIEDGGINLPYAVSDLNFEAYRISQEDPRVVNALDEWSACMADGGYDIEDPIEYLPAEIDVDSPEPSEFEIEMALWDVECQERTDLINIWFDAETEIQEGMLAEQAEVFAQIDQEYNELLRRVADVLDEAGS